MLQELLGEQAQVSCRTQQVDTPIDIVEARESPRKSQLNSNSSNNRIRREPLCSPPHPSNSPTSLRRHRASSLSSNLFSDCSLVSSSDPRATPNEHTYEIDSNYRTIRTKQKSEEPNQGSLYSQGSNLLVVRFVECKPPPMPSETNALQKKSKPLYNISAFREFLDKIARAEKGETEEQGAGG